MIFLKSNAYLEVNNMKRQSLVMLFFLCSVFCEAQSQYIAKYLLNNNIEYFSLIDPENGIKYILDDTQIYISAIDENGNQLWRTDPWKDNDLEEYRTERPIIIYFSFANNERTDNKDVIMIIYNNTQFGIIDKSTGKFKFLGQD
ncbi:MAG: hypothetical protein LBV17_09785 [Treponema sp.]|jgi:hypothetical protein|nr:hypothetical protein [Treponema sp.]